MIGFQEAGRDNSVIVINMAQGSLHTENSPGSFQSPPARQIMREFFSFDEILGMEFAVLSFLCCFCGIVFCLQESFWVKLLMQII